jgi:hypothetical protein
MKKERFAFRHATGQRVFKMLWVWFAKTPAEAQNGAVLDGVSLNTIIDSIQQEDFGEDEPECVEDTYIKDQRKVDPD